MTEGARRSRADSLSFLVFTWEIFTWEKDKPTRFLIPSGKGQTSEARRRRGKTRSLVKADGSASPPRQAAGRASPQRQVGGRSLTQGAERNDPTVTAERSALPIERYARESRQPPCAGGGERASAGRGFAVFAKGRFADVRRFVSFIIIYYSASVKEFSEFPEFSWR